MFKTSPETIAKVKEHCDILITTPNQWEGASPWMSTPTNVYITERGNETNKIKVFTCYMNLYQGALFISMLKAVGSKPLGPAKEINRALMEAYLLKFLEGLIPYAVSAGAKSVVVESDIPIIVDTFLEKGFKILKKNSFSNVYGGSYEIVGKN
jgi:hypothetical protein